MKLKEFMYDPICRKCEIRKKLIQQAKQKNQIQRCECMSSKYAVWQLEEK